MSQSIARLARAGRTQPLVALLVIIATLQLGIFLFYFSLSIHPLPRWDYYDWVVGYLNTDSYGQWLWTLHNEHRVVTSKLLVSADVALFNGRLYPVAISVLLLFILASVALCRSVLQDLDASSGQKLAVLSVVTVILFPTFALDNFAYPSNMPLTLAAVFFVLAISAFLKGSNSPKSRESIFWYWVSMAAAVCCSLSSLNGLLVWFVLVWMAWRLSRFTLSSLLPILSIGALLIGGYVMNSSGVFSDQLELGSWSRLQQLLDYLIAFYGMPWVSVPMMGVTGIVIGAVMVVSLGAGVVFKGLLSKRISYVEMLGVALLMFSGGTAVMIAIARESQFALPAHRYTIFVLMAHAGLLLMFLPAVLRILSSYATRRSMLIIVGVLGATIIVQQILIGQFAASRAQHFAQLRDEILAGNDASEISRQLYPNRKQFKARLNILKEHKLYIYREEQ
ncbi:MAG: hypothetical protein ACI9JM_003457 [Halioglobus sp.]